MVFLRTVFFKQLCEQLSKSLLPIEFFKCSLTLNYKAKMWTWYSPPPSQLFFEIHIYVYISLLYDGARNGKVSYKGTPPFIWGNVVKIWSMHYRNVSILTCNLTWIQILYIATTFSFLCADFWTKKTFKNPTTKNIHENKFENVQKKIQKM